MVHTFPACPAGRVDNRNSEAGIGSLGGAGHHQSVSVRYEFEVGRALDTKWLVQGRTGGSGMCSTEGVNRIRHLVSGGGWPTYSKDGITLCSVERRKESGLLHIENSMGLDPGHMESVT